MLQIPCKSRLDPNWPFYEQFGTSIFAHSRQSFQAVIVEIHDSLLADSVVSSEYLYNNYIIIQLAMFVYTYVTHILFTIIFITLYNIVSM